MLPTFQYCCLNKFCNSSQSTFMGSNEWYHNLASPNIVRLNLWTFTPLTKQCVFIQSFEQSRCISASSSGFPENSSLKSDQFKCIICCCCYVRQYASIFISLYMKCLGVSLLHIYKCVCFMYCNTHLLVFRFSFLCNS